MTPADLDRLAALKALVDKLEAVVAHPAYQSQVGLAYAHGFKYDGPTWGAELAEAKRVLAAPPAAGGERPEGTMDYGGLGITEDDAARGERTCERCRYSRPELDECFNVEAFGHHGGPLCSMVKFCGAFAPRTDEL